ncbi:hypothetical protein R50073_24250 [Maricurvus nonylphenolicus]|uniref:hypothetical protein n=1 Tax=Maricurvus nonylphenolicus TaxID=1008307 RepID=UPI0036F3D772
MSKTPEQIKEEMDDLRQLIDSTDDAVVKRIAYEMETAIRSVIEDVVDWPTLSEQAIGAASMLRDELQDA